MPGTRSKKGKPQMPLNEESRPQRGRMSNPGDRAIVEEEQPIESVPLYRNFKLVVPLLIVVIAVAAATWFYLLNKREYVTTDDAYIDGNRASISAKMLGRIDRLTVDEGDTVRQGQVLVRLDESDLRAQETQADASLMLARENITLAKVSLERARADFDRASSQFRDNVIPREQFDHAGSEMESAKARLGIAVAQARTAEAQLGIVRTQIHNASILSPLDGVVSKRWALAGDVVQPGQAILSVSDLNALWVTANLEENRLAAIRLGARVAIRMDAYPGREFAGTVIQIGSNTASQFSLIPPNNAAGNFTKITQRIPVKISIEPPAAGDDLKRIRPLPGMSVEVKVKVR
jgi:membrane fusion protein, multidrug efflux system